MLTDDSEVPGWTKGRLLRSHFGSALGSFCFDLRFLKFIKLSTGWFSGKGRGNWWVWNCGGVGPGQGCSKAAPVHTALIAGASHRVSPATPRGDTRRVQCCGQEPWLNTPLEPPRPEQSTDTWGDCGPGVVAPWADCEGVVPARGAVVFVQSLGDCSHATGDARLAGDGRVTGDATLAACPWCCSAPGAPRSQERSSQSRGTVSLRLPEAVGTGPAQVRICISCCSTPHTPWCWHRSSLIVLTLVPLSHPQHKQGTVIPFGTSCPTAARPEHCSLSPIWVHPQPGDGVPWEKTPSQEGCPSGPHVRSCHAAAESSSWMRMGVGIPNVPMTHPKWANPLPISHQTK